jgi:AraC-like DNA-binding protein
LPSFKKYDLVEHVPPKHKNLGQKREMAKTQLENIVSEFPQMSIRKAASSVGISPALVYHIFTDDLHFKSLKFHLRYRLEDRNYEKKPNFSHRFLKQSESTQAIRNMH